MMPLLITTVAGLIDKLIPDQQAQADAKIKMLELAQRGELAELEASVGLAKAQIEVNQAEATTDAFRGGWRPATGWVCVCGLAYQFLLQPLLPWACAVAGLTVPPLPKIDNDTLMLLLTGMLGLGGMRTFERVRGKA